MCIQSLSHFINKAIIFGSEFEKLVLLPGLYSFSLEPSAQYKAIPISQSSRTDMFPISPKAFRIRPACLLRRSALRISAPLLCACFLFSVILCFWRTLKPTPRNQRESVDLATGIFFKISEYVFPCLRKSIAFWRNSILIILYICSKINHEFKPYGDAFSSYIDIPSK